MNRGSSRILLTYSLLYSLIVGTICPTAFAQEPKPQDSFSETLKAQIKKLEEAKANKSEAPAVPAEEVDGWKSGMKELGVHITKESTAWLSAGSLAVLEVAIFYYMMRLTGERVKKFTSRMKTAEGVRLQMRPLVNEYLRSERALLRAFAQLDAEARAEVLKMSADLDPKVRTRLASAFDAAEAARQKVGATGTAGASPGVAEMAAPANDVNPLEKPLKRMQLAYTKLAAESEVAALQLNANVPGNPAAQAMPPWSAIQAEADLKVQALGNVKYASGNFAKFKNDGLKQIFSEGKLGLKRASFHRTFAVATLFVLPIVVLGGQALLAYGAAGVRRTEDRNAAINATNAAASSGEDIETWDRKSRLEAMEFSWERLKAKYAGNESKINLTKGEWPFAWLEADSVTREQHTVGMGLMLKLMALKLAQQGTQDWTSEDYFQELFKMVLTAPTSVYRHLSPEEMEQLTKDLAIEAAHIHETVIPEKGFGFAPGNGKGQPGIVDQDPLGLFLDAMMDGADPSAMLPVIPAALSDEPGAEPMPEGTEPTAEVPPSPVVPPVVPAVVPAPKPGPAPVGKSPDDFDEAR